jgi:hypothetical protein
MGKRETVDRIRRCYSCIHGFILLFAWDIPEIGSLAPFPSTVLVRVPRVHLQLGSGTLTGPMSTRVPDLDLACSTSTRVHVLKLCAQLY